MAFRERRLRVVGVGGTLREGSASLGALRRALAAAGEAGAGTERVGLGGGGGARRGGGPASLGALGGALAAAGEAGAETELLDLRELDLPMYEPGRALEEYGPGVGRLGGGVRGGEPGLARPA